MGSPSSQSAEGRASFMADDRERSERFETWERFGVPLLTLKTVSYKEGLERSLSMLSVTLINSQQGSKASAL